MSNVIAFRRGKFALGGGRFGRSSSPEDAFIHNAAVDLRFDVGLYRMGKLATTLAAVDALHTRASGRWVKNGSGIWSFISNSAMAIVPGLGYDGREGFTNFVQDPLFNGAVVGVVGSGGAPPTGVSLSSLNTVEIVSRTVKADGLTWLRVKLSSVNGTGSTTFPRFRFADGVASTAGQVWRGQMFFNLISTTHALTARVEGVPFESIAVQGLSLGVQEVNVGGTATATPTTVRWQFGPGVAPGETFNCEFEVAAPQLISKMFGMPFGVGAVSADNLIIPAAQAGMAINPSLTGMALFWRGRDLPSTEAFPALLDARVDVNHRFTLSRNNASGAISFTLAGTGGSKSESRTLAQIPRDTEFSAVATWRPDGGYWVKIGGQPPQIGTWPQMAGAIAATSVGNRANGSDWINHITRRAGFLPMGLSDRAALDLFNQVNEGLAA